MECLIECSMGWLDGVLDGMLEGVLDAMLDVMGRWDGSMKFDESLGMMPDGVLMDA